MKKPLIFALKSDMLPFTVVFYIGPKPNGDIVGRVCLEFGIWNGKGTDIGDLPKLSVGCVRYFSNGAFLWLPSFNPSNPADMDTFVHEMVHINSKLGDCIGQDIEPGSDELFAYFSGWVTSEVLKRVKKHKKRRKGA